MKNQLDIIRFATFLLIIPLFISCKIATVLSKKKIDDNLFARYALFYNNRTGNHKPVNFSVSLDTLNTKSRNHRLYMFYLNSDTVEKFQNYKGQRENYILTTDSSKNNSNEKIIPLTQLETQIFDKIIYFSDSLKLKDFDFLKKGTGFKLVHKN